MFSRQTQTDECVLDLQQCHLPAAESRLTSWLTSQEHLAWSINLTLTQPSSFMCTANANGSAAVMTARCDRFDILW